MADSVTRELTAAFLEEKLEHQLDAMPEFWAD